MLPRQQYLKSKIKILGTTEEVNSCSRCGRNDLEKTIAVEVDDEIIYLGSSCIAHRFEFGSVSKAKTFINTELDKRKKEIELEIDRKIAPIMEEMEKFETFSEEWENLYAQIEKIKKGVNSKFRKNKRWT